MMAFLQRLLGSFDPQINALIRPPRVIFAEPEPDTLWHGAKLRPTGDAFRAEMRPSMRLRWDWRSR